MFSNACYVITAIPYPVSYLIVSNDVFTSFLKWSSQTFKHNYVMLNVFIFQRTFSHFLKLLSQSYFKSKAVLYFI